MLDVGMFLQVDLILLIVDGKYFESKFHYVFCWHVKNDTWSLFLMSAEAKGNVARSDFHEED